MTTETYDYVISVRVEDLARPVAGATQSSCAECHRALWLAPTTRRILAHRLIPMICMQCLLRNHTGDEQRVAAASLTEEQYREVLKDLGEFVPQEELMRRFQRRWEAYQEREE